MTNVLGAYNPTFFANEALIQLEKALGMAGAVHRGHEEDRNATFMKGDTIRVRRPATFTAQNAPSTIQDVETGNVDIVLDQSKEVKFGLTDQELSYTSAVIIDEHIRPAAYAIADEIDLQGCQLFKQIPWVYDGAGSAAVSDITGPRKLMRDNRVPLNDADRLWLMMNAEREAGFLDLTTFHSADSGAGGAATQVQGTLGRKFGMNLFANQNVQSHTPGTLSATAVLLQGAGAKGDTSVTLDAGSLTGTLVEGDTFVLAGNTQRYAVTALATAAANAITVSITPALVQVYADNTAGTVDLESSKTENNIAFHRNFAALAMAPLSDLGDGRGAEIATVSDPITGLSLQVRMFYVGDENKLKVSINALFGWKVLDGNLGVRLRTAP